MTPVINQRRTCQGLFLYLTYIQEVQTEDRGETHDWMIKELISSHNMHWHLPYHCVIDAYDMHIFSEKSIAKCIYRVTHGHIVGGSTWRKKLGMKILSLPLQTCWLDLQAQNKQYYSAQVWMNDIKHTELYTDTYLRKKKRKALTHLLFNLLERRLVMMCSSDAHFTFLRLLFNSSNYYCVYRRAVSLNTTHTLPLITHAHNIHIHIVSLI